MLVILNKQLLVQLNTGGLLKILGEQVGEKLVI